MEVVHELLQEFRKSSRGTKGESGSAQDGGGVSPRDALWADSLGVSLTSPKLVEQMEKAKPPPMSLLKGFAAQHLPKEYKGIVEDLRESVKKNDKNSAVLAASHKLPGLLWEKFQRAHEPHARRKQFDKKTAKKCLLLWLLANLDTFLKVIPHVEYGRYPGVVCKKSRTVWYSERRDALRALEKSACGAFDSLCAMIED